MHIGIFAERFLGRYGADRVLVILAELLQARGHQVTLVGVRFSPPVVDRFARHTLRVPDFSGKRPEQRTLQYFQDTAYFRQRRLPEFDACIVGSFPFISAIPYLRTIAQQVVFIDFGVVPTQGYPAHTARLIEQVRSNRRRTLPQTTHIVAISDFIARDQARPDCQDKVPVSTVLLGADHLLGNLGRTEAETHSQGKSYTAYVIEQLRQMERKRVLVLGRWEPGCYKNSQAAFTVLRVLLDHEPNAALLVMAQPGYFTPEPGLENNIVCLGLPTDAELVEITTLIDAGISVSLWEGFNLPVAELQYQEKDVFAFDLAAHPEVVVSKEQLCTNAEDMAAKLACALQREGKPAWVDSGALVPWREKFTWQRFMTDFSRVLERAA
jgi:glycosyltransferase involved in cell wall biosynthesis